MKEKRNFSIFVKLICGFMLINLLTMAFSFYAIIQLKTLGGYFDRAYTEAVVPLNNWSQFKLTIGDIRSLLNYHIAEQDLENQAVIEKDISIKFQAGDKCLKRLGVFFSKKKNDKINKDTINTDVLSQIDFSKKSEDKILADLNIYWNKIKKISSQIISDSNNYMKEDALMALNNGNGLDYFLMIDNITSVLLKQANNYVEDYKKQSLKLRSQIQIYFVIGSIFFIFTTFFIGFMLSRNINKLIAKTIRLAEEISRGNFSQRLNMRQTDEIGKLSKALDKMADGLESKSILAEHIASGDLTNNVIFNSEDDILGKSLDKMTQNLRTILSRVNKAGQQVASGSGYIRASSQSLSQGASEQASSLEEITSSMVKIALQTRTNAENAFQANKLADQARQTAEDGRTQMGTMITAMKNINESSQVIAKIIKVIDEIAFQSNLLALNAAVEAARAGRYGKGFAVVAEEVRNLAGRSAKAAKETAKLIEISVKNVESGNNIAAQTAKSLNKIVESVVKTADLVNEIAVASNEQANGVEQINQGLSQVEQITQDTSANAEDTAIAAAKLTGEADELNKILAQFILKKPKNKSKIPDTDISSADILEDCEKNDLLKHAVVKNISSKKENNVSVKQENQEHTLLLTDKEFEEYD